MNWNSRAFSDFCEIESSNQVPDGDTLGQFRNILMHNGLQEQLFAAVIKLLQQKYLLLKKGTIVDSTIIAAPSNLSFTFLRWFLPYTRSKQRCAKAVQCENSFKVRY